MWTGELPPCFGWWLCDRTCDLCAIVTSHKVKKSCNKKWLKKQKPKTT